MLFLIFLIKYIIYNNWISDRMIIRKFNLYWNINSLIYKLKFKANEN